MTAAPAVLDASARCPARRRPACDGTAPAPLGLVVFGENDLTPFPAAAAAGLVLLAAARHAGRVAS